MADKLMDEVMREFNKRFLAFERSEGWVHMDNVKKTTRKACRSYARKVVEEILDSQHFASYGELHRRLLNAHSRLTDKEPK